MDVVSQRKDSVGELCHWSQNIEVASIQGKGVLGVEHPHRLLHISPRIGRSPSADAAPNRCRLEPQ